MAEQFFEELSGAITYHEYGHFWAYGMVDSILLRLTPTPFGGSLFYFFPDKVERDADFISGVLSKKAGHKREIAEQMFDILAFAHLYRSAGLRDIRQVESSYIQYLRNSPQYQPLNGRKQDFARGYN